MADQNTFGIAGLLGWPVAHSRSPVIHNHWLAHYGIPGRYVLFAVPPEKLEAAVRGIAALGCDVRYTLAELGSADVVYALRMQREIGRASCRERVCLGV